MSGAARVFNKGDRVIFRTGQAKIYGEKPGKVYTVLRTYPHKLYKRTWVDLDDRGQPGGTVDSKELRPAPREPFIGTAVVNNPGRRRKRTTKRRAKKLKDFPITLIGDPKHAAVQRETIRRLLRRNPGGRISEKEAWQMVRAAGKAIRGARFGYPNSQVVIDTKAVAASLVSVAGAMLAQLARGVHENPAIAVLGNPGDSAAGTLSDRVYEVRYRHAQDGRDYKHPFGPGVRATLLKDGRVVLWHPSKRIWKDFT